MAITDFIHNRRWYLIAGISAIGLGSGQFQPVQGGEFTPIGKTGGQYRFTDCAELQTPALRLDPNKRGNSAVRDYNLQVGRYNAYIAEVQTYMDCLTAEADRDLETYYKAVSATLAQRQVLMQDNSDRLRKVLARGPNKARRKKNDAIPALDGAAPVTTEVTREEQ